MLLQLETLSMGKGAYIDDDEFKAKSLFYADALLLPLVKYNRKRSGVSRKNFSARSGASVVCRFLHLVFFSKTCGYTCALRRTNMAFSEADTSCNAVFQGTQNTNPKEGHNGGHENKKRN